MSEPRAGRTSRLASFGFAFRGIGQLLRAEPNARIHLAATIAVVIVAVVLGLTAAEGALLVVAVALVWIVEAFNTSIERLADAVTLERHPLIGVAKDVAAGAVLIASIAAALIGLLVIGPHIL